jgi:phytoene synthase
VRGLLATEVERETGGQTMVAREQVAKSKAIQRRTGKTFHLATRVLPERVRHDTYVLYAFFRIADEVVDDADGVPPERQRARLESFREAALGRAEADDPVLAAFSELRERHGIAESDVNAFIDAMLTDVSKDRYETYEEVEAYMDGSAAAVGRMMTAIMHPAAESRALPHATALGEAFQLTNFLRDVREDIVERGRVYLPQETLADCGVDEADLLAFRPTAAFREAMRREMERTEGLYREGVAGIEHLPEDCQFAVLVAAVLYAEHHRVVRRRDYDVLSSTPSLSTARKVRRMAETWWHWRRSGDPETVFYRVSAVDPVEDPGVAHEPNRGGTRPRAAADGGTSSSLWSRLGALGDRIRPD